MASPSSQLPLETFHSLHGIDFSDRLFVASWEHQLTGDSPQTSHPRSSLEKLTCHSLILSGSLFLAVHRQASLNAFFRRTRAQCQSLLFLYIGLVHLPVVSCHPNKAVFVLAFYYL